MRVVICGGGVIGACTAYFLSLRQVEVIVVERTGVACAASGKSGGFLALDWCDGSAAGSARPAQLRPARRAGRRPRRQPLGLSPARHLERAGRRRAR